MRNKLLQEELLKFWHFSRRYEYSTGHYEAASGIQQIREALLLLRSLPLGMRRDIVIYGGPLPESCLNEPEIIKMASEKLSDGIERAKELLAILEKHYGEVEKKPRGGSFSCCDPCACESAAPCSPRRPQ